MDCVCFTVIVDDIVLPHGETVMEVLGGGGPQTLFGYQLVTNQSAAVGLSAGVGPDLPQRCQSWLDSIGVDCSGLVHYARPTPRAWQVFEEWGRRTQIWRGRDDPCDELYDMLRPKYDTLPPAFQSSSNYHLGIHPLYPPRSLMRRLRAGAHANGGGLSIEPYTAAERPASPEEVSQLLACCDIFSPNESEAESLVGPAESPLELARRLLALSPLGGAEVIVVRCGPQGVVAVRRGGRRGEGATGAEPGSMMESGAVKELEAAEEGLGVQVEAFKVPAVADTQVVDVTGCGNAFCGGFLAALYRGGTAPIGTSDRTSDGNDGSNISAGAGSSSSRKAEMARNRADVVSAGVDVLGAGEHGSGEGGGGDGVAGELVSRPSWLWSSDLASAAAWGCVAGSFMAEERGVPLKRIADLQARASQRLNALLPQIQPLQLSRAAGPRRKVESVGTLAALVPSVTIERRTRMARSNLNRLGGGYRLHARVQTIRV